MSRSEARIAVIEDDADIAFTLRVNLEREGYAVSTFANGHEGLISVQQGGFDFLVLDLHGTPLLSIRTAQRARPGSRDRSKTQASSCPRMS